MGDREENEIDDCFISRISLLHLETLFSLGEIENAVQPLVSLVSFFAEH